MKDVEFLKMDENYTYIGFDRFGMGSDGIQDMVHWCTNYEGAGGFCMGGHGVYFEREEDAVVFALRYS